jgi:hypothetical protein
MKDLLKTLALIACLVQGLLGFAQEYFPIPESNAYWICDLNNDDLMYMPDGDTLVNGKTYVKIYELNDSTATDTTKHLLCLMRQEPENKKIWFIRTYLGETSEKLGYDLNVELGDTVSMPAFAFDVNDDSLFKVHELFTVDIFGQEHKVYRFNNLKSQYSKQYWEGVYDYTGTIFPNLSMTYNSYIHPPYGECAHIGIYVFPDDVWQCDLNLVNIEKKDDSHPFSLEPNPAADMFTIKLKSTEHSPLLIYCYNALGQCFTLQPNEANGQLFTYDISWLQPGFYIIKSVINNHTFTTKLLKTNH